MQMLTGPAVWATALAALAALVGWSLKRRKTPKLPSQWALTPRPVFNSDERHMYRLLREALPHHVILAKLPLVRFCQPTDAKQLRYWYDLLGSSHVAFAICSASGRVLATVDVDSGRPTSRRLAEIKQAVLAACRVRHMRCSAQRWPSVAELQMLLPQSGPAPSLDVARDSLASTVATRRAQRSTWSDSRFQDSFFAVDSRLDALASDFAAHLATSPPTIDLESEEVARKPPRGPHSARA